MVEYILKSVNEGIVGRFTSIAKARKEARALGIVGAVYTPSGRSKKCVGVVFANFHFGETVWFSPDFDTYFIARDGSIKKVEASRTIAKEYFSKISRELQ